MAGPPVGQDGCRIRGDNLNRGHFVSRLAEPHRCSRVGVLQTATMRPRLASPLRHSGAAFGAYWLRATGNRSSTMSEDVRFEIPKEMRSMAEASFEQARKTFEKFLENAKATA